MPFKHFALLLLTAKLALGQAISVAATQSTGWNSSFELSFEQVKLGNLTSGMATIINTITNFDRSQLANGGAHEDEFYNVQDLPEGDWPTEPGKAIKIQESTDPSPFAIPAKTAMSRIVYSTTNANGFYANGAPSVHRALFYADIVPFALAKAGYAVVAPDYAGLGVDSSWNGSRIPHQYFVRQAGAYDALNALRAAKGSFSERLSSKYVVMGHSQGGAVAWGLAEILSRGDAMFEDVSKDYLGAVIAAPPTDALSFTTAGFLAWVAKDLDHIYPTFKLSDWFTPLGVRRIELLNQIEGSQMVTFAMFSPDEELLQPDWRKTSYAKAFEGLTNPDDVTVPYNTTKTTVEDTCQAYPGDLEFVTVPQGSHFSAISAAQQMWLRWIEGRFDNQPVAKAGCIESQLDSLLSSENYQVLPNSFLQWAGEPQWSYELPTAL
ncbi:putative secretory lipase [Aspergillus avenaceus]|uniref:Putative secretory lipase n=1 Tax=Aspergillus avenaceus TaxID=36643 RepID=A0A5N6TWT3_ASPAV|nr:putative secretory lipase [Aspergillus avenaceus]